MLEKYLKDLGLSDKEASVYLALLQVDSMTVLEIARKTKINRTTIYPVIESLEKKGLVNEMVDKKNQYIAESPERLETYVERQKIQLEENEKKLKDIIPQLKGIQRETGERPVVKYYEGLDSVLNVTKHVFDETGFDPEEKAYMIYPKDLLNEIFSGQEMLKLRKTRVERKIKAQTIYTFKDGELLSDEYSTRLKIDGAKYPIDCDIFVYKDVIRIATLTKKLSSIYIKSADLAETIKSMIRLIHDLNNRK